MSGFFTLYSNGGGGGGGGVDPKIQEDLRLALGLEHGVPFDEYVMEVYDKITIPNLFSGGEQGAWYDPSDITTLFQDEDGTMPITTSGQLVALMLDKSGNGNHATQPTASQRPVYHTDGKLHWLEFDGVDDRIHISEGALLDDSNDFSVFAGVTGLPPFSDTAFPRVLYCVSLGEGINLQINYSGGGRVQAGIRGTPAVRSDKLVGGIPTVLRYNNTQLIINGEVQSSLPHGGQTSTGDGTVLGGRVGNMGNAHLLFYGSILLQDATNQSDTLSVLSFLNHKIGLTS